MNIKIGVIAIAAGLVGASVFSQSQRPAAMPELKGALGWLNSSPLNAKSLRGKVVLVDFWTYTCINSIRPMPSLLSRRGQITAAQARFVSKRGSLPRFLVDATGVNPKSETVSSCTVFGVSGYFRFAGHS